MPCTILLVEDEPNARRNIALYLQRAKHNVHQVETGEAALDLISQMSFHAVISDLRLPSRVNGIAVLQHQKETSPGKRIVLITAYGSTEIQLQAKAMGALYMEKPLLLGDLLSSIETHPESGCLPSSTTGRYYSLENQIVKRDHIVEKLKETEEGFRLLVEGVRDYAIYSLDPDGFVTTWNTGAQRIKGYTAEEIIGKHFSCFYTPEDVQSNHPDRALQIAAAEGKYEEENLRVRKDGSVFWASVLISALRDRTGELRGFAKVVQDITERKESEQRLREKDRLATLGTTAAVFAHEVGNTLNGVSTSLQVISDLINSADNRDPLLAETIEMAHQDLRRLTSLLGDYRSFAKPQTLKFEPSDLRQITEEVLAPATNSYKASGISVTYDFDEDLPLVPVDREKIRQVVLNVCKNAVEAMPDGGILSCKAYQENDRFVLEISDTGIGIPDGLDVFQLFKTTKPYGTGLGLPIVEQIISEHRGAVDFSSQVGKGTTFRISLPLGLG